MAKKKAPFGVLLFFVLFLDLAADEEVVDGKADPAAEQHQDRGDDLTYQTTLSGFEDIQYAPYRAHDT